MLLPLAAVAAVSLAAPPKFELKDGDRIVWVGNTLVEREQRYGYWETALHAAYPKINFTLRNLGWSGDTVYGDARAGFENAEKGFERLVSLTLELKPTVIFVSYGQNESFDGAAGLPRFEKGLNKLLDALKPANARVVLFTPLPAERHPAMPAADAHNRTLARYAEVIRTVAGQRRLPLADLGPSTLDLYEKSKTDADKYPDGEHPLTVNGLHLGPKGYQATSSSFQQAIDRYGGFPPDGNLNHDGLRAAVVAKNELFFHRWRPQNETYLFGFRKHEQGVNAKEVAEFDPLVSKAEDEIARIKKGLAK